MSTPMHDVPEHFPMPVNADGEGPLDADETSARIVCWCGNPGCFWTRALAEERAATPPTTVPASGAGADDA